MISTNLQKNINSQINEELYSSYLYLSISAYCSSMNFKGFANWFSVQAQEETDHAMGLYNYLIERGGRVLLMEIAKPPYEFKDICNIFEEALKHEKYITGKIHKLYEVGQSEKDYAFGSFIQWYINEQVEEEANATEIVETIKLVGSKGTSLYLLDKQLAGRVYKKAEILK
jgi:ferritin